MPISALDESTARLITTTQVITSVYSTVKEIVENAFDAKAKNIEVNLADNGTSLIEVKDDGIGIPAEDAIRMALPSCTSKITNFEDLGSLETYGFRGEALHALCKVSDVVILTKTETEEFGRSYAMNHDGQITKIESHPRTTGTTISVQNLFKNIPVRRQLITDARKASQNVKSIELLLKSFGICNPHVRISYKVNGTVVFVKPSTNSIEEAVACMLGRTIVRHMKWIDREETEVTIQLMIPDKNVQNTTEICQFGQQYIFVNNRPVVSKEFEKLINNAILEYFDQKILPKKKPIFLLYILVNPMDLDVNLEPNKNAVLFKDQQKILNIVQMCLTNFYGIEEEVNEEENICNDISNCYLDYSANVNEDLENERPACKKRKLNCNENLLQKGTNDNDDTLEKEQYVNKETNLNAKDIRSNSICIDTSELDNLNNKSELNSSSVIHDRKGITIDHNQHHRLNISNITASDSMSQEFSETLIESDFCVTDSVSNNNENVEAENISQLPVVDLGEDFELKDILNKTKDSVIESLDKRCVLKDKTNITNNFSLEAWSKGHVEGLKGGTDVMSSSDTSMTNVLSGMNKSAPDFPINGTFIKFAKNMRSQIIQEEPSLTVAQVAHKITNLWKNLPSQEHGYYQDLVQEEKLEYKKKEKAERKEKTDKQISEQNRKRLLQMFQNMKHGKTKPENAVMRTIVGWNINLYDLTASFRNKRNYNHCSYVIGPITDNLWIVRNSAQLWILDILYLKKGLNVDDLDTSKIHCEDVENLFERWLLEKKDMSMLFPIHKLD